MSHLNLAEVEEQIRRACRATHPHDQARYLSIMIEQAQSLVAEVKRLKEGNFTPEEFQNLCHNLSPDIHTRKAFEKGCIEYQKKLLGEEKK